LLHTSFFFFENFIALATYDGQENDLARKCSFSLVPAWISEAAFSEIPAWCRKIK